MKKEEPNTQADVAPDPLEDVGAPDPKGNGSGIPDDQGPETETGSETQPSAEDEVQEEGSSKPEADAIHEPEEIPETEEVPETDSVQGALARLRDQHLRLAADFENYRKRSSTELAGVWVRARADLVRSLVEGLDDLQRVSQFTSEDTTVDALIEGVDLVERNLLKALTDAGLEVLNPEGERFDPNSMEAMMRVPTEEEGPPPKKRDRTRPSTRSS